MSAPVDAAPGTVWWLLLVRAVLIVAFGLVALVSPGIALLALVYVFGSYALLDGVTAVSIGIRGRRAAPYWAWSVVQGAISILAGLVAFIWPDLTALTLLYLIAFWAVVLGIAEIGQAFGARSRADGTWAWTAVTGLLTAVVGILLLIRPGSGIFTLLWLLGVFAIAAGIVGIGGALRFRATTRAGRVATDHD